VTVTADVPTDLWPVLGDPTQLHQVLLNLGVNARDAMPSGGALLVTARNVTVDAQYAVTKGVVTPGRYVVVTLSDTGTGMTPAVMRKIFDPFFSTKAKDEGTGLGLSTTHAIVRSHGGYIDVRSTPGAGSTFEIFLPVDAAASGRSTSPFDARELPRGNGERVLVVDDESSILAITRQTLETFGYRVLTAEDGAQAIGLFAINRSDIAAVITDMMMPVMDGVGLATALRRLDPQVRIVGASGLDASASPERLAQAGIQHFLAKPYSADTLLTVLKKALTA
jgi:CheY-like chemotaxis protein